MLQSGVTWHSASPFRLDSNSSVPPFAAAVRLRNNAAAVGAGRLPRQNPGAERHRTAQIRIKGCVPTVNVAAATAAIATAGITCETHAIIAERAVRPKDVVGSSIPAIEGAGIAIAAFFDPQWW